jgi:hypothetical protein
MTVTKLQVDVLVQAAMFGPMGATNWTPLVKNPDALGRELLSSGRRASGERNAEDYVFEPLPVAITAIEAIQACRYYHYQRAKTPAIVAKIRNYMLDYVDGMRDAPWGWTSDDTTARLGRPAPASDVPAPPPAALIEVADRLAEIGVEARDVTPMVSAAIDYQVGAAGKFHGSIVGTYVERTAGRQFVCQVNVLVAKSPAAADRVFPKAVEWIVWRNASYSEVRRVGNLVVMANLPHIDGWPDPPAVSAALDRLGTPDEQWSTTELPVLSGPGKLLGNRIEMTLASPAVAINKIDLERLLDFILDPDLKDQLREVDLRKHSVVAAPKLQLGAVVGVEVVRTSNGADKAEMAEDLVITHERSDERPIVTGSIVVTPRLRRRPSYVRAAYAAHGRFYGWWSNTTSLRSREK